MAIVEIRQVAQQRAGTWNEKGERNYTRTYWILTDDATDDEAIVLSAGAPIPARYTPHSNDPLSFVKNKNVSCVSEDGKRWEMSVEYSFLPEKEPTDRDPEITWSFAKHEQIVEVDVNGDQVVNTASEPFDPPVVKDDSRPILHYKRIESISQWSIAKAYLYRDSVNSVPIFSAPAGAVKLSNVGATLKSERIDDVKVYYYEVSYEFEFNLDTWKKKIVSAGLREKEGTKRKNILVDGVPVTSPVPLDSAGKKLDPGDPPVILDFEIYNKVNFASVFGNFAMPSTS